MISRELKLPKKQHVLLFGPRQTGKTTLIRESLGDLRNVFSINLLIAKQFAKYSANPSILREEALSLSRSVKYIFIDEVQRVPDLLNEIHALIEEAIPQIFILTGSSARKIKRGQANLLAGRAWALNLHPLTANEIGSSFQLSSALHFGTLPRVHLNKTALSKAEFLRSYTMTYLKEEVDAEALSRNIGGFIRFLGVAAQGNGELLNFSNVARDVQLSSVTVKEYFKILEDTLIGFFLPPFHFSERKKHRLSPKFYFFDTGVLRALQERLRAKLVPASFEYGNYFETWIVNEVRRISSYQRKDLKFSFLRTAKDAEIDLIVETPRNKIIAVEIKSKPLPTERDFSSGFLAIKALAPKAECLCVCTGDTRRRVETVDVLPFQQFLDYARTW